MTTELRRALAGYDVAALARRVGGEKESRSPLSQEWLFACPFCGSSRLRYNHAKGAWLCWKCRRSGDTLTLIASLLRCDEASAIDHVLTHYVGGDAHAGALASTLTKERPVIRALTPLPWPEGAEVLTEPSCAPHARAWAYLASRGIDAAMVREYRLAFGRAGRLANRIIFPCHMDGALVYWQARATWEPPPDAARGTFIKVLNPLATDDASTHASEVLFGYDRASVEPHIVVCEGPIDAIKVGPHAVALLGKVASPAKLARIRRLRAHRVTLYLDRGTEERASAERIAASLAGLFEVRIATPPEGHDPGSLDRATNAHILAAAEPFRPRLTP